MSHFYRGSKKKSGFTLIEVLVAIAVIAFVLPALMTLMIKQADYAGVLRDKAIATWIAENKMTELRLAHVFLNSALQREEKITQEMAGADWTVMVDIVQTGKDSTLVKYIITVELNPDSPLAILEAFVNNG